MRDPELVREAIALSWKRSAQGGLIRAEPFVAEPEVDLDPASRLLRAAAPVLDELEVQISGTGFCILLADSECRIVARLFDSAAVERRIEQLGAVVGSRFAEDVVGTNALGTPLEIGHGIVVNGEDHYLEHFGDVSCYGHPIVHPITRRVEGILDMTGIGPRANPLFGPFLSRAAKDIERRLLEGSRVSQQRLVEAFQRVSPQQKVAVTAVGMDILLSNRIARDLLSASDHEALRAMAAGLRVSHSRTARIELDSGALVRVEAEAIAGTDGGAVFLIRPELRLSEPIRRGAGASRTVGERISEQLRRLRSSDVPVAVCGEAGTGRSTAAREIAGELRLDWADAARIAVDGPTSWLRRLLTLANETAVLGIDHVEFLPISMLPLVADLIDDGPARIVLCGSPAGDLQAEVAALVARCPERVDLPALRYRTSEFVGICRLILADVAPGTRCTQTAAAALAAAEWPGNLTELTMVLSHAAASSSTGRIETSDLPLSLQTSPLVARLAGRERAERQAIVDALTDNGGNKVHAAHELGISRSTLYSRLRALDIDARTTVRSLDS